MSARSTRLFESSLRAPTSPSSKPTDAAKQESASMLEGFRRKEKGGESKRTTITKTKESVSEDEEEENLYQDPSTVIRKPKYDEETPTQEEGTLEPEESPRETGENPKDPEEPPEGPGGEGGGPPPPPPPPPPQSNPLRKPDDSMKTPKPQVPTPFGGDREKWVTFVFQSLFYYNHYREFFRDPENKCIYFLSWFEGETVRPWADQILSTIGQRNQSPLLRDFDLLLSTAAGLWGPVNQRERAQNKLDNINQRTSVSAYHAEFIAHATRSEYNEETLARIFYIRKNALALRVSQSNPECPRVIRVSECPEHPGELSKIGSWHKNSESVSELSQSISELVNSLGFTSNNINNNM